MKTPMPDAPPSEEQQARIDQLTGEELRTIDDAILANATGPWRKVAMVVGLAISNNVRGIPGIPDVFYAQRVKKLVEEGQLESRGDLNCMRFSEVRQP